ncbi:MAG: hypothetical protein ACOC1O_01945 [bacterium]
MKVKIGDKFVLIKDSHKYIPKGTIIKIVRYYSDSWWEGEILNKDTQYTGWDVSEDYLKENFIPLENKIKKIT